MVENVETVVEELQDDQTLKIEIHKVGIDMEEDQTVEINHGEKEVMRELDQYQVMI